MSTEHLEELRRRLAEQTDQGSTNDRVTTDGLAGMRRRLRELKHISENTIDEAEAMSAEEEVREIMDSLANVRQLRPPTPAEPGARRCPYRDRVRPRQPRMTARNGLITCTSSPSTQASASSQSNRRAPLPPPAPTSLANGDGP